MKSKRQGLPGRTAQPPLQDCAKCSGGGVRSVLAQNREAEGQKRWESRENGQGSGAGGPRMSLHLCKGGIYVSFLHRGREAWGRRA